MTDIVYTERAILLALMTKMYSSHFRIDDEEEEGFQHVLCVHLRSYDKTLTWHIADDDLKYFKRLFAKNPYDCNMPWYTTDEKYEVMEMMI